MITLSDFHCMFILIFKLKEMYAEVDTCGRQLPKGQRIAQVFMNAIMPK
jgi:hypothetical protein